MDVENCWYVAAEPAELDKGILSRRILGRDIALFRTDTGRLAALEDRCLHRLAPLSLGRVQGELIVCGYHGARYDTQGTCVHVPGQNVCPTSSTVRSFPVLEKYGYVWIWMGLECTDPDGRTIPAFMFRSADPAWLGGYGHFESIRCGYRLINDNLIDITHVEYVHPESFAIEEVKAYRAPASGGGFENGKMTYELGTSSMVIRLRALNLQNGPFFRWMVGRSKGLDSWDGPVDFDLLLEWQAPALASFLLNARPAGVDRAEGVNACILHMVTPESDTSSHYFFRAVKDFALDDDPVEFMAGVCAIFEQDKAILEGQQRNVGERDLFECRPVSFGGDFLQLKARGMIERYASRPSARTDEEERC